VGIIGIVRAEAIGMGFAMGKSEAETAHDLAICAAIGAGVAQDWSATLDHLQRAAELGLRLAQAELAALAGDWLSSQEIAAGKGASLSDWARLRRAVDLAAWLAVPRPRIASASPRVAMVEGFAAPEICDWLIERARPRLAPAKVYDHDTGGARSEGVRTNSECHFSTDESDLLRVIQGENGTYRWFRGGAAICITCPARIPAAFRFSGHDDRVTPRMWPSTASAC
jgi:hypothetical protein